MTKKVLVVGAGPAGYTAALYASRAGFETTLITGTSVGGQLMLTHMIENYPGVPTISGMELMDRFQHQVEEAGVYIVHDVIEQVDFTTYPFELIGEHLFKAEAVILASGSVPKWLNIPGEEKFKGKGIGICAICDGFFYRQKEVAVIGGGNTALYEALYLAETSSKVFLIYPTENLQGEEGLKKAVQQNSKRELKPFCQALAFEGEQVLTGVKRKNIQTDQEEFLPVSGVFVAIGSVPNTDFLKGKLALTHNGFIQTDKQTMATSVPGVFACGDVQEPTYRQAIIAAGSGCIAALSAEKYLKG